MSKYKFVRYEPFEYSIRIESILEKIENSRQRHELEQYMKEDLPYGYNPYVWFLILDGNNTAVSIAVIQLKRLLKNPGINIEKYVVYDEWANLYDYVKETDVLDEYSQGILTNGKKYVEVASLVLANVNAEYKCHEKAGPDHEVLYLCNITNLIDGKGLGQIMLDHIIQYYKDTFKQIYLSITIDDDLIKKTHEDNPQITLPYKYDKIDIEDKITYYEKFGFIESKKYINYQSFSYDFIFIHVLCKQVD